MSFAVGVWAYSIGAVKQDEFHDVDEEARELARSGAQVKSLEDEAKELAVQTTAKSVSAPIIPLATTPPVPTVVPGDRPRGVVASLLYERYPQLLDPASKTLVWGAPPVDNIGKFRIGSRR
ncbi:hypothetical protein PHLCEN_2v6556 [Hermanssonia centrifuga]|nr:hypothetical protein PHLCEN_2v6556 [Hermanssonia centrifuga]